MLARRFAIVGGLLAFFIGGLMAGFHPVFLPGALASALALWVVAGHLGSGLERADVARPRSRYIGRGVLIALAALLTGIVTLGGVNMLLAGLDEILGLGLGMGPWYSLGHAFRDFVIKPTIAVMVVGGPIAAIFGFTYGLSVYHRAEMARFR